MNDVLEVKGLKKHFPVTEGIVLRRVVNHVLAVDGVSFAIGEGECFALVGESGCGKTTTAKMVLRLESPTAGQILFRGQDITQVTAQDYTEYRRGVQAVFQDPFSSLQPRMRVEGIVEEPLLGDAAVSRDQRAARVREVLAQVGLNPATARNFPHEFSGGQRQRIAIARALSSKPALIVLDEPVSSLDVSIRAQIINMLRDLQEELRLSYLLIAHDLATVRYMAHRIGIMYLGKLVELGTAEAVFDDPLHPYTKALLSAALPLDPDLAQRDMPLPGEVPSPLNPPAGCHFHPRCPFAMAQCSQLVPELKEHSPGHWVSCHLYP